MKKSLIKIMYQQNLTLTYLYLLSKLKKNFTFKKITISI
jgi:hypothetical protein